MKKLAYIIVFLIASSCYSQNDSLYNSITQELKPPFSTQGQQEDFLAQELFKKEYKPYEYSKFIGEIEKDNKNRIRFEKFQSINLNEIDSTHELIFTNGLLYPNLFNKLSLNISNLEELQFLSNSPKIKRFRFWLFSKNVANPTVYIFELQNNNATMETSWEKWIKGAKLSFLKEGWVVL